MFDLRQLGPRTYVIEAPVNLGVFLLEEGRTLLIDSGLDGDTAKRILRIFTGQGWTLTHILNTHSHADHIGGNALLSARTGCAILAPREEAPFVEQPWLEPALLYGGYSPRALQGKHMMAKPSVVTHLLPEGLPQGLSLLPLPGHSPGMVGVRTGDGVLFLADSLLRAASLEKYPVPYLWDFAAQKQTLDLLTRQEADWFVPCHAEVCNDISSLIEANRLALERVIQALLEGAGEEITEEALLCAVKTRFGVADNAGQYALAGSTLRSCLAYLEDATLLEVRYAGGVRLFHTRQG